MKNLFTCTLIGLTSMLAWSTNAVANTVNDYYKGQNPYHYEAWVDVADSASRKLDGFSPLSLIDSSSTHKFNSLSASGWQDGGVSPGIVGNLMAETGMARVPVPAAAWLFASGLIGLIGISRRKNKEPQAEN